MSKLEADGLLSADEPLEGSLSYMADFLARLHLAEVETDIVDGVRDFQALTGRYYDKLIATYYPEVAKSKGELNR